MAVTTRGKGKRGGSDAFGMDATDEELSREVNAGEAGGRKRAKGEFGTATASSNNPTVVGGTAGGYPSPPGSPSSASGTRSVTSTPRSAAASPKCPLGNIANSPKKKSKTSKEPKKPASRKRKRSVIPARWQLDDKSLPEESIDKNPQLKKRRTKLKYDESILKDPLEKNAIVLETVRYFQQRPYKEFHAEMMKLVENDQLLITELKNRNTFTNGYSSNDTASRLLLDKLLNVPEFRDYFFDITTSYKVKHCWIAWYGNDGWHPFHRDGRYRGTHRIILSLGCIGKEMWFQQGDSMCGIKIEHGGMVKLSKEGGGVTSSMSHSTCKTGKSILIGFEVDEEQPQP